MKRNLYSPCVILVTSKTTITSTLLSLSLLVSNNENLSGCLIMDMITGTYGKLTLDGNGVYLCEFIENGNGRDYFISTEFASPNCLIFY